MLTKDTTSTPEPKLGAKQIADARDIADLGPARPRTPSGPTGHPFIDQGAKCEVDAGVGCFLEKDQRERLTALFRERAMAAMTQYQLAITSVRMDKLVEKEEDLSWVVGLLLDLAGAHILSALASSLKRVRKDGLSRLLAMDDFSAAIGTYTDAGWTATAQAGLHLLTERRIEGVVKPVVDLSKAKAKGTFKAALNQEDTSKKAVTVNYLDSLQDEAVIGFQALREQTPRHASDAELVVMFDGLDAEHHKVSYYKEALAEKLKRFHASGVTKIGRKHAERPWTPEFAKPTVPVIRDTRVVWLVFKSGVPLRLAYENQDGDPGSPDRLEMDMAPGMRAGPQRFGPTRPLSPNPKIGEFVPIEFTDVALANHKQAWGEEPAIVLADEARHATNPFTLPGTARSQPVVSEPLSSNAPIKIPDQLKLKSP